MQLALRMKKNQKFRKQGTFVPGIFVELQRCSTSDNSERP
jgi:hypothetical protein